MPDGGGSPGPRPGRGLEPSSRTRLRPLRGLRRRSLTAYAFVVPRRRRASSRRGGRPSSARRTLLRGPGVRIERVLTDNGSALPQPRLRGDPRAAGGTATSAPGPTAPDQRQGRALHPHPARRVGLRSTLPLQRRAPAEPSAGSTTSTIMADPTPPSEDSCPTLRLSTTSAGQHN